MSLSYKKLWKQLIDRDMTRTELRQATGLSPSTFARLSKGDFQCCKKVGVFSEKRLARHTCDERSRASCPRRRGQGRKVDCQESGGLK